MSYDVKFYPLQLNEVQMVNSGMVYGLTVLGTASGVGGILQDHVEPICRPLPVGVWFHAHEDDGLRRVDEDAYGRPLEFATAGKLVAKIDSIKDLDVTTWDKAVFEFLRNINPTSVVIVYWH